VTLGSARDSAPAGTGSPMTRWLGLTCLAGFAVLVLFAFGLSPEDDVQRDAVRMLYIHVPVAFLTYVAFVVTAVGSVMWLWKRSIWWDMVAHSSAEIGVIFCGLTLFSGSIWGRPTWGTYWEWGDVRLVTTLILFLVYVGYLSVRSIGGDEGSVATRAAVVGLIGAVNLPIVNRSVEWWFNRTLHQQSSLTDGKLEDLTLFTMFLGLVVMFGIYVWMMIHRFRLAWLERERRTLDLDKALLARRAEAAR
jgi:heme exporter protein C